MPDKNTVKTILTFANSCSLMKCTHFFSNSETFPQPFRNPDVSPQADCKSNNVHCDEIKGTYRAT